MFTKKELRGKNTMLDRVQRQQDVSYSDNLSLFNNYNKNKLKDDKFKDIDKKERLQIKEVKEPIRIITKAEIGNKRKWLR